VGVFTETAVLAAHVCGKQKPSSVQDRKKDQIVERLMDSITVVEVQA
jgi:hypothetical protein